MSSSKKISNEIDLDRIKELANFLAESDLSEIEIEIKDMRIRLARERNAVTSTVAAHVSTPPQDSKPPATEGASQEKEIEQNSSADKASTQFSPMVGTAYLAPEPGAAPYVNIGTKVAEGQTLMIIEAMKTMNQIPAERQGTVTEILIENGQPVEYGDPLVVIE